MCFKHLKDEELSKDVTSDIFRDLLEHPHKLDNIRNVKNWLYRVIHNRCLRVLTKVERERNHMEKYVSHDKDEGHRNEETYNASIRKEYHDRQKHLINSLKKAIEKLRDNHRVCIVQHYLQHKSYQEIMDSTKYTFKQVDNFLYYGKKRLKVILKRDGWNNEDLNDIFN